MSKILQASCENLQVKVANQNVENVNILSSGKTKSNGYLMMDKSEFVYIAIPIESMKNILDEVSNLASNVNDLISKITVANLGVPTQGWASPPTLPTVLVSVSQAIDKLQSEINELKENLQ
ncbi:MAG: hypothetical protein LBF97_03265 [Elusimicrobiota bacterium]|jgi:wobble nucleotide-excising tRNase|nr:hypothetical protein [Elusimicrobiota bacterium]